MEDSRWLRQITAAAVGINKVTVHTALSCEVFSCYKHENPETYGVK